jgi:dihydropteroate synthase
MGVLNLIPDSLSDGGRYDSDSAVLDAMEVVAEGADIIDINGESTRLMALRVSAGEQMSRVSDTIGMAVKVD